MGHTCERCDRTFSSALALDLHRDTCGGDQLLCRKCGERFAADTATRDGWFYACPNADCDGEGIGEDLLEVERVRVTAGR